MYVCVCEREGREKERERERPFWRERGTERPFWNHPEKEREQWVDIRPPSALHVYKLNGTDHFCSSPGYPNVTHPDVHMTTNPPFEKFTENRTVMQTQFSIKIPRTCLDQSSQLIGFLSLYGHSPLDVDSGFWQKGRQNLRTKVCPVFAPF